jgi:hypothetical protein
MQVGPGHVDISRQLPNRALLDGPVHRGTAVHRCPGGPPTRTRGGWSEGRHEANRCADSESSGARVDENAELMALLARAVARGAAAEPLAQRLCRACLEILEAQGAAITLAATRAERLTVWATDPTSADLENLQDVIGEGPSHEAFDSGRPVAVRVDAVTPGPYAVFADMAEDLSGAVTIWALPMRPTGTTIGVLTLYRRTFSTTLKAVAWAVVSRHLDFSSMEDDSGRPRRGTMGFQSADDDSTGNGER